MYHARLEQGKALGMAVKSATSATTKSVIGQAKDFVVEHPIVTAAIGSVAGLTAAYYMRERVKKLSLRVRGIQGESARPGSHIVKDCGMGHWPDCQVLLYEAGALWSTYIGCGVRVGDWLVTYNHVVQGVNQLVARTPKGYFVINPVRVTSTRLADVCYYQLPQGLWSQMGTQSANKRPVNEQMAMRAQPSMVWAKEGYTQGTLAPLHLGKMKMEYSGTTEPGFSGAPYMGGVNNSKVLGLHQGVQEGHNVGYIWYAILEDIRLTFYTPQKDEFEGERAKSRYVHSGGDDKSRNELAAEHLQPRTTKAWSYRGLTSQIESMEVGGGDWAVAKDDDFEWNADLQFDGESAQSRESPDDVIGAMESFSQEHLEVMKCMAEALILKKRSMVGQSPDQPVIDGGSTLMEAAIKTCKTYTDVKVDRLAALVGKLNTKVEALEESRAAAQTTFVKQVEKKKGTPPPQNPHKCLMCPRSFQTGEGLAAHQAVKGHSGERARQSDHFLGGKKPSHSFANWRKPSSSADKSQRLPVIPEVPPNLVDTLSQLASSLSKALKAMSGQDLEQGQNSKV